MFLKLLYLYIYCKLRVVKILSFFTYFFLDYTIVLIYQCRSIFVFNGLRSKPANQYLGALYAMAMSAFWLYPLEEFIFFISFV